MTSHDFIPLTGLTAELAKMGVSTSYPAAHRRVASGQIPAERVGIQWIVKRSDLPAIAAAIAAARPNALAANA